MEKITLGDGRNLSFDTYGDPEGLPVIFSHGLSDSALIRNPDEAFTESLGVRMIAADEPGVGGSSPQPGRKFVDWGKDMEELADSLGLEKFAVAGHSGGGPHTLAIAARLPDRVTHGVLASPVCPFDREFRKKLTMRDLKVAVALRHFHHVVRWAFRAEAKSAEKDIGKFLEETAKSDPSDASTFLDDPDQRKMFEASFTEGVQQDEEGIYEMMMGLWDWGFELGDVPQPFDVFYGDADDILSPEMPKEVAETLPQGTGHVWPGAGHYGFVDRDRWGQYLGALTAR